MPNANKLINHNKSKNTFFNDITNIYISSCSSQYCISLRPQTVANRASPSLRT